jgi:hypothetical protein
MNKLHNNIDDVKCDDLVSPPYGGGQAVATSNEKLLRIDAKPSEVLYSYFIFLCDLVSLNDGTFSKSHDNEVFTFFDLAQTLHHMHFYGGVPNDVNRDNDGKALRVIFAKDHSSFSDYSVLNQTHATMLEFFVALALRINEITAGEDDDSMTDIWFWTMLNNLGIVQKDVNDGCWGLEKKIFVEEKITKMLDREYQKTGPGPIFPLDDEADGDARELEIWYQMQFWLKKHYF